MRDEIDLLFTRVSVNKIVRVHLTSRIGSRSCRTRYRHLTNVRMNFGLALVIQRIDRRRVSVKSDISRELLIESTACVYAVM